MAIDVLICNLTRLGDLLQTQPLLDDLHENGLKAGLVCLENFVPATKLLRHVSRVWPLPGARISSDLDRNWPEALRDVLCFARKISEEGQPRYILNLTPSLSARLFTRLMAEHGAVQLGFGMDAYGFGENHGFWSSFLSVAAHKRINAPFNLADMLRRTALPIIDSLPGSASLASPPPEAIAEARKLLSEHSTNAKGFVAFQLGASEERRRWPVSHFRRLGQIIWENTGIIPVLLGAKDETALGEEYARGVGHPFANVIGKTDIPTLGALLRECRLLVTNDTGTMHLAAGLGTKCLAFFLATAQPWDTGPLLPGCCCLEPALPCHPCPFGSKCDRNNECRSVISPEAASDLVLAWLRAGEWQGGVTPRVNEQCRVWITRYDAGCINTVTRPENQPNDERGIWLEWLREFWRQLLDDMDRQSKGINNAPDTKKTPEFPGLAPKFAKDAIPTLDQAAGILLSLRDCGELAMRSPQAGQIFLRHCESLQALLDDCAPLNTLGALWRELRRNHATNLGSFLPLLSIMADNIKIFGKELALKQA